MNENDLLGIVKKPAFDVVIAREIETTSENGQGLFDILPMWEEFNWSDDYFPLTELAPDGRGTVTGAKTMGIIVFKAGTPKFTYSIAVEKAERKTPPGCKTMHIPAATWAVFYVDTWKQMVAAHNYIFTQWFPSTGHRMVAGAPIMQVYVRRHGECGMYYQMWVPIEGEADEIPLILKQEDWGKSQGFPIGGFLDKKMRVGNFSGGFERWKPDRVHVIKAPSESSPLMVKSRDDLTYAWGSTTRNVSDYLKTWPVTGLLIARHGELWVEEYKYGRAPDMRFTSMSIAKSVTSLLLGICLDKGIIKELDDTAEMYVPSLKGTLHGGISLRDLSNMSSGAAILHDRDNMVIYPEGFWNPDADLESIVKGWNKAQEPPGTRFNYNELCAFTVGMVIREVTGMGLAEFCQETLWQPMGAEDDAVWLTDSKGKEFNCVFFSARLRDWARLGQMVAQNGLMNGRQIVSKEWIDQCSSWSDKDQQVRYGKPSLVSGYKTFFWHYRKDGSWMMMGGALGQHVFVDRNTQTVLVQTAIDELGGDWMREMLQLFGAATQLE